MKKAILKTFLAISGITALRGHWLPAGLYCFNYHRIGNPQECAHDRGVFSCSAWRFEEHVAWIMERFEVVTIDKLLFPAGNRGEWNRPLALITFDDGYIDSYTIAFPILKRLGATAVFFLPTLFIGTNRMPWWDEMAWILRHARHKEIRPFGTSERFLLDDENLDRSIRDILLLAKTRQLPMCEQTDDLAKMCGGARPESANDPLFLDWNQPREMRWPAWTSARTRTRIPCWPIWT